MIPNQLTTRFFFFFAVSLFIGGCIPDRVIKRPNIIFILTDDQRWDALGYAGNHVIHTPHMDDLAKEGTYFRNAFVTTPICAASRASLLTGLYERTHGYTFQQGDLKEKFAQLTYPSILKKQGYITGFYGKLGVNYPKADSLFDHSEFYDLNYREPNRKGYFYKTVGSDTVHLTRYTGHLAEEFIQHMTDTIPFCLSLSFSAPHANDSAPEQYFWQSSSDDLYSDVKFQPPALSGREHFNSLPIEVRDGFNRTRWYWRYDTPEKYQHSLKGYYRMISEVDQEIGRIRELLRQRGLDDNTVIIFMSDNGYFLGERQLAGKWLMYEESIRVPCIIFDPRAKRTTEIDDLVLNIDIPPTILDFAGIAIPQAYQGLSLAPYVQRRNPVEKRDTILVEHLWDFSPIPSSEGVRTARWKYFRYRFIDAPEELYDLETDPREAVNLAQNTHYANIVEDLRTKCDALIDAYSVPKNERVQ